jgi:HK97 family phage major capsid protein
MTETHETKAMDGVPTSVDVVDAFDDFMRAFEAYKAANDERLAAIENRLTADVVTTEKMARIDRALDDHRRAVDELVLKSRRPRLAGEIRALTGDELAHKAAFEAYVRKGETNGLSSLELKALEAGTPADGGYLVPDSTEREIGRLVTEASPIRAIAAVREVSVATYKKPFAITGMVTGWAGETDARPETATPTLAELEFPAMELYAMPAATPTLLEDSAVNLDEWISSEVHTAFAEQEGTAFVTGDGVKKPTGFLDYPTVDDSTWSWGNIGYVPTGVSGALPASDPSDVLVDLVYALKAGHRANGHWVMNRRTQGEIRKLKDADGHYLWQPPAQPGGVASLMNFPIAESEDMPDIGADSYSIAFGDFRQGYLIIDRRGVRVLRDPYSSKPHVLFYTTKRVGGGVQNFEAIKLLKFGIS